MKELERELLRRAFVRMVFLLSLGAVGATVHCTRSADIRLQTSADGR